MKEIAIIENYRIRIIEKATIIEKKRLKLGDRHIETANKTVRIAEIKTKKRRITEVTERNQIKRQRE